MEQLQYATIDNCYTSGSITIGGTNNATSQIGGLLGWDYDNNTITNCFSSCSFPFTASTSAIGGLVGQNDDATGSIKYCYSISNMNIIEGSILSSDKNNIGGFCGFNNGSITDCYYDQNTSGQSDNTGKGTPKTTAQMQTSIAYSGSWTSANWSFVNGYYPKLIWQAPSVTSVSVPANKTYKTGDALTFTVNFDQNVTVANTPQLSLTLNTGGTVQASYTGGNGTSALTFSYTVQSGNQDNDGITVGSLSLNGGTIKSSNNIAADLTLAGVASTTGVLVDGIAPTVSSVNSSTSNGSYKVGDVIAITVNFSENVNVTGTPKLALNSGGNASYSSGNNSTSLTFNYTVAGGENSSDLDYSTTSSLSLNGGTISDAAGNAATLTLPTVGGSSSLGGQKNIVIDGIAPTVTSVSSTNATYIVGQNLDFTVNFSEAVTVVVSGGTPYIPITLNTGGTVNASYYSGSGTTALGFRYTVVAGNLDNDGIAVGSAITANGGTIKDATGNNATLTLVSVGATTSVLVDGIAPTVSSINRQTPSDATTTATSVVYRVTFSEAVKNVGTSDFTLTKTGAATGTIASSGTTGNTIDVTVNSISGVGTLRLDLSSTGITDNAGNAISGSYTSGQTYTTAPATSSWTGTGNWSTSGNWGSGIPGTLTNVTISSGTCTVDANVTVNNLTVSPGAALTISSGKTLTVTGTLILDASSTSGTASLINNGSLSAGNIIAKNYLSSGKWHIISPIASGQSVSDFLTANANIPTKTGTPDKRGLMDYNTADNTWNDYYPVSGASGTIDAGKGYSARIDANGVITFTGNITSSDYTKTGLITTGEGWNCIGNPYTSSISMNELADATNNFLTINASNLDASYACVYIWDEGTSSYKILGNSPVSLSSGRYLTQNYVAPGQGFFVKVIASSISFTTAMQSHQNNTAAPFLKSAKVSWPVIKLNMTKRQSNSFYRNCLQQ